MSLTLSPSNFWIVSSRFTKFLSTREDLSLILENCSLGNLPMKWESESVDETGKKVVDEMGIYLSETKNTNIGLACNKSEDENDYIKHQALC